MHAHGARALEPGGGGNGEALTTGCRLNIWSESRSARCRGLRRGARAGTRSSAARRPCTATTHVTRIQVSTMEACSASIDSRENVKAAPGSHADVAASICLSTPTS